MLTAQLNSNVLNVDMASAHIQLLETTPETSFDQNAYVLRLSKYPELFQDLCHLVSQCPERFDNPNVVQLMKRLAFSTDYEIQTDALKYLNEKVSEIDAEYLQSLGSIANVSRLYYILEDLFDSWGYLNAENQQ